MPMFGQCGTGKWHLVGPDGCWYGQELADTTEPIPDETVTTTDIVAYDPFATPKTKWIDSIMGGVRIHVPRKSWKRQLLVIPPAITASDTGICTACKSRMETRQKRRTGIINTIKRATPFRDVDWRTIEYDSLQVCYWCRAHEATLWASDTLDSQVCPACGRMYNSPLGAPGPEDTPEEDCRPVTPTDAVTPIVFGTSLPGYDPADLIGRSRPQIEVREKIRYVELELDLKPVGHSFTPEALTTLRTIRESYAEMAGRGESRETEVDIEVGLTAQSVTLDGVDLRYTDSLIRDCWAILGDPSYWFRIGWPDQERVSEGSVVRSIPGDEPVVDVFPRLQTQSPAASVDTEALRQVTESERYKRGERYYTCGSVTEIECVDGRLQATVQGRQSCYDVQATVDQGRYVEGRCSCPDYAVPCKHIVAAVLASGDVESIGTEQAIEDVVSRVTRDELETFLLNVAEDDIGIRRQMYEEFCG